jgi:serine/threonine protein kinase
VALKETKTQSFSSRHWADLKVRSLVRTSENVFLVLSEQKEEALLKKLIHPNIVRYLESIYEEDAHRYYLVQEYCESGSLADLVRNSGAFPETLAAVFIRDSLLGLQFMHERGVVHGDIKGANILLTTEGVIKVDTRQFFCLSNVAAC